MGAWISTLFNWNIIYSYRRNRILSASASNQDPFLLLAAAAEIVASHRSMEEFGVASSSSSSRRDSNVEVKNESDTDSEEDCEVLLERGQQLLREQSKKEKPTDRDRFIISDKESYQFLQQDVNQRCGRPLSIQSCLQGRELCTSFIRQIPFSSSDWSHISLQNSFFPNCRKVVDKFRFKMFCCQYIKNGEQLVVASQDEYLSFYSPITKRNRYKKTRAYKLSGVGWSILDVAVPSDGNTFAYATWKDSVIHCRVVDPTYECPSGLLFNYLSIRQVEDGSPLAVFSVRFSYNSEEILAGCSDHSLHIFDIQYQAKVCSIEGAHGDDVNTVCYGDNSSNLLCSGGDDGLVKVWDRRATKEGDKRPVGVFAGHRDGITFIDSRGDNRYLLSNSKDQTIKLWDLRRFASEKAVKETLMCVSRQRWDYRWQPAPPTAGCSLAGDSSVLTLRGHSVLHTLIRAKFSPENTGHRYIYTGCARGEVVVFDILSGTVCRHMPGHVGVVRDVSWNPNHNELASCSWDGTAAVWKWDERKDHPTGFDGWLGEEESCDEFYMPINRKNPVKRCKRKRQN